MKIETSKIAKKSYIKSALACVATFLMINILETTHGIEIEDLGSWPQSVLKFMQIHEQLFINFRSEEANIQNEYFNRTSLQFNSRKNSFESKYFKKVEELEVQISEYNVIGYHCTRLTFEEIESIKTNGLTMLNTAFIRAKFQGAVATGHLSETEANLLLSCKRLAEALEAKGNRIGMLHFCASRSVLKDYYGVFELLKYWGGEVTHRSIYNLQSLLLKIESIGTSAIIKCSIPLIDIRPNYKFCERMISFFIRDQIDLTDPPYKFDFVVKRDINSVEVVKVISFGEDEFRTLTDYHTWPHKLA